MSMGPGSHPGSPMGAGHGGSPQRFGNIPDLSNNAGDIAGPSSCMDASPCGVAHLCFEPEGTVQNENWKFVGDGRGEFSKMQMYYYAGDGAGTFSKQESRADWGKTTRQVCQGFMIVLGIAGVIYLVYTILTAPKDSDLQLKGANSSLPAPAPQAAVPSATPGGGPPAPAPPTMRMDIVTSNAFNCEVGFFNWRKAWSHGKQRYCCEHFHRGCTTNSQHSTTNHERPHEDFDCIAGIANWEKGWSPAKKLWCCAHHRKGCKQPPIRSNQGSSTFPAAHTQFDCRSDGRESSWIPERKVFCCMKFKRGCPAAPPAPPATPRPQPQLQQQQQQQQQQPPPQPLAAAPRAQSVPVRQQLVTSGAGCNALCTMNGVSKSCRFLVHFAATRRFAFKPEACRLAHAVVRTQCGNSCSGCTLDATGCS
mmetsp:Transcript_30916/g.60711  ORF Transcript_30916/g.60711 Transcript_30916/m.60711 type:complete len:421 (+) Transcript_30916:60-1322(+)